MTIYEAMSLLAQFSLLLTATMTFIVTLIVVINKKK